MIVPLALFTAGMFLSAFFSGSETGFYRVSRARLLIDALGGDFVASGLIRVTNAPALFVATTLIGNNVANFVTSHAIVLATKQLASSMATSFEALAPVAFSPLVFVYGELLPKNLFYSAPNRLLRLCGPLFLAFTVLLLPISLLLAGMGKLLEYALGQTPLRVQLVLARKELMQMMLEGQQAGVLHSAQQQLADRVMTIALEPILARALPASRFLQVKKSVSREELQKRAKRKRASVALVVDQNRLVGYVRTIDVYLSDGEWTAQIRELREIRSSQSQVTTLGELQVRQDELAQIVDDSGHVLGILDTDELLSQLV